MIMNVNEESTEKLNNSNYNETSDKDKKKKRPTLAYYQPPKSRINSNKSVQNTKDVPNKETENVVKESPINDRSNTDSKENDLNADLKTNTSKKNKKSYRNSRISQEKSSKEECNNNEIIEDVQIASKNVENNSNNFQKLMPEKEDRNENLKKPRPAIENEDSKNKESIANFKEIDNKQQENKFYQEDNQKQDLLSQRGGILKISFDDINIFNATSDLNNMSLDQNKKQIVEERNENTHYKTLFDPNNPVKPIYVQQNQQKAKIKSANNETNEQISSYFYQQQTIHDHQQRQHLPNYRNPTNEAKTNAIIQMMHPLENHLKTLIEACDMTRYKEFFDPINDLRKKLENLCLQAIFTNIEISTKWNVDLNYWKVCYHQLIESLRKEYSHALNSQNHSIDLNQLKTFCEYYINEGFQFYENLISKLEETFNFNKNDYLDLKKFKPNPTNKIVKIALLCVNRSFICLGDLARYKESLNDMKDYCLARSYYLKAMYIAPKCSRAYNQLAILALYTRRRLDAVYYYIRCLELNQPLLTARQSLITLFDEARKRSEIITENLNKKKLKASNHSKDGYNSNRIELWMKNTVVDNSCNNTAYNKVKSNSDDSDYDEDGCIDAENDKNELLDLSTVELNKRFMHDYLNLIGKLFTKVGMDSYAEVCSRMLYEFRELLKREPCPIGKMRLLQITIINISIVNLTNPVVSQDQKYQNHYNHMQQSQHGNYSHHSQLKQSKLAITNEALNYENDINEVDTGFGDCQSESKSTSVLRRSQLQESAIQLSLDMFAIIVKKLTRILSSYTPGQANTKAKEIFPSVKIFSEWMMENSNLWFPLPDQLPPDLGPNPDLFQILSNFLNQINNIDLSTVKFYLNQKEDESLMPLILDEDKEIIGFLPLNHISNSDAVYVESDNLDLEILKDYRRLDRMHTFGNYLCNLKKPIIKYDIMKRLYSPFTTKANQLSQEQEQQQNSASNEQDQEEYLRKSVNELSDLEVTKQDDNKNLSELIVKHKNLKAKVDEQLKREKSLQTFIESTTSRRIELKILPRFLVPDTNCFIDHLNLIEILLKSNRYIIVIPLVVINELDKLAKSISNYNDDSIEHAEMVQSNARKTMEFLNEKFEKRERNLKALTSQGSVLETIQFRSEEIKTQGSNDDLILGCCLHYCRDNARDFMPTDKNDAIHLFREVVLLTEDRNLRLKAHTRNVPVKNIIDFCKWANIAASGEQQVDQFNIKQKSEHIKKKPKNFKQKKTHANFID